MASTQDASRSKATQDSWILPTRTVEEPKLKVDFVTKKPGVVTWYNCGPTVYDASHMGHARNYMAQDIMRRILRDYFGYEVHFVMNITDVDDKIILRARQSHLLDKYTADVTSSSTPLSPTFLAEVQAAWSAYVFKTMKDSLAAPTSDDYAAAKLAWEEILTSEKDLKWVEAQKAKEEKFGMYLSAVRAGLVGLVEAEKAAKEGRIGVEEAKALITANHDAISLWLDKKLGSTVNDPTIFRDLAAYWEDSYFKSMAALHVERPTTLTRVSEYLPEIVTFVEGIVNRGLAYEAGGSVWFDTTKFEGAKGEESKDGDDGWKHTYAKLQPWSKGNRELLEDGEGSLTSTTGKRSASDFALWKASKPGEPEWPSTWGPGRPGWHIECSVMASAVLGEGMDVHSGGVDLAFPHHDNEIAQSEAFHNCRQWVNYFLHTGHLHIEGLKMSKSLKNFVTIDDALLKYSARQLRFSFLLQTWNAKLDFKESAMQEVRAAETLLNNFFAIVNALAAEAKADSVASDGQHHFNQPELDLLDKLEQAQLAFRVALCDSFDTPKGLQIILDLVSATNVYLARGRAEVNISSVVAVADWVTRMLRMFGLGEGAPTNVRGERLIGWGTAAAPGQEGAGDRQEILMPYLRALSAFRDSVRKLAMEGAPASEILALSDQFRDYDAVELGIALDDQADGRALFKLMPPESLRQARDAKLAAANEKAARKAATAAAAEVKRLERLEKGRTPPTELFRSSPEYSAWDEQGIPTLDKEGVEVPKSRKKKCQKEWDAQKKLHDEFLKESSK
ncbi:tRNA synthetases class I (C) catalytic domain-domain-containing protein [Leucosporidium creatinivorum]|uniref:cysteine--tRNA ligase n=1 Tax=Leucosporidium creatinivorum TaxID=106004 RepID=A0A1Y2EZK4_9BASI|nr:tRNA synthetases class I (C) catalytic domain-domain-containing protein [Leucosporidium creatinivorum]